VKVTLLIIYMYCSQQREPVHDSRAFFSEPASCLWNGKFSWIFLTNFLTAVWCFTSFQLY